jgi:hypothetical protein
MSTILSNKGKSVGLCEVPPQFGVNAEIKKIKTYFSINLAANSSINWLKCQIPNLKYQQLMEELRERKLMRLLR